MNRYIVYLSSHDKCLASVPVKDFNSLSLLCSMYKSCNIEVVDLQECKWLDKEAIKSSLITSRTTMRTLLEKNKEDEEYVPQPRIKKCWSRRMICVETGKQFATLKECATFLQIPYMTLMNKINRGDNVIGGLHFQYLNNNTE